MEHAKKVALVPQQLLSNMLAAQQYDGSLMHLGRLDDQMQSVLKQNIPDDLKAKAYSQVLHRFMTSKDQELNRPLTMQLEHPAANVENFPDNLIIDSIPKNLKNKAKLLMSYLKRNNDLKIDEQGVVTYKGTRIPGSNVVDLVHMYVRPPRRNRASATGWQTFQQAITDSNVPVEALGTRLPLPVPSTVSSLSGENFESPDVTPGPSRGHPPRTFTNSSRRGGRRASPFLGFSPAFPGFSPASTSSTQESPVRGGPSAKGRSRGKPTSPIRKSNRDKKPPNFFGRGKGWRKY